MIEFPQKVSRFAKLSKALESFNTMEPPSANLKENLPSLYKTIKDCYVLSASCYIRMD